MISLSLLQLSQYSLHWLRIFNMTGIILFFCNLLLGWKWWQK